MDYMRQNKVAWNEIAAPRRAKLAPAHFFRNGGIALHPYEREAAGDVRGKRVLHLQCSSGSQVLSFAALGADAVGVDFSEVAIEIAREIAQDAGIDARFVVCNVFDLPPELQAGDFDIVFTGEGALCWLPDIWHWARIVAAALRPGGFLLLNEGHPVRDCLALDDGALTVSSDYFARETPSRGEGGLGVIACGAESHEDFFTFTWPLGDIITALARAHMRIDLLEERSTDPPYYWGPTSEGVARHVRMLPGEFFLKATRE